MTMMKKADIEGEVLKTLEVFDHPGGLPPDPHFYSRVLARVAERGRPRGVFSAAWRPALLAALVVLNLGTAVWYLGARERPARAQARAALKQVLAADLNLADEQEFVFIEERE